LIIIIINNREDLINQVKYAYYEHLWDADIENFFCLKSDSETGFVTEFHISKLNKYEKTNVHLKNDFVLSVIPNVISGNLASCKVVIFNLNMGAGKDGDSFFDDILYSKYQNLKCKFSPYTAEGPNGKFYSFSQTMFHEALNNNEQMNSDVRYMLSNDFTVNKAKIIYGKIKANLTTIYEHNLNRESQSIEAHKYYLLENELEKYNLDFSHKGINTLSNFYRHMIIPLLQLKFPFETKLNIAPVFIASDPYYLPIDDNTSRTGRFRLKPSKYNWNGNNSWIKYIFGNKKIYFLGKNISLLEKIGVQKLSDVMLMQLYPYASNNFTNKKNLDYFHDWKEFIRDFVRIIDQYNGQNKDDQIQIIFNRNGNNYIELNRLVHTIFWTRETPYSGRSGFLSSYSFKKNYNRDTR